MVRYFSILQTSLNMLVVAMVLPGMVVCLLAIIGADTIDTNNTMTEEQLNYLWWFLSIYPVIMITMLVLGLFLLLAKLGQSDGGRKQKLPPVAKV